MSRTITQRLRQSNNLWWVTAGGVLFFAFCAGGAILVQNIFFKEPTALPSVPTFVYNTLTPASTLPGFSTLTPLPGSAQTQSFGTPQPTITLLPFVPFATLSTPTNRPSSGSIFPSTGGSSSAIQPTPIQAVVVTLTPTPVTPTNTSSAPLPPPPPTQGPPSATTCKNILYPARPGNQWVYYVNTPRRVGDANMRIASVEGSQAVVDVTDPLDGSTSRAFAQCDQDIILNFPLLSVQSMVSDSIDGTVNVDYVGGVLAPNEAAFTASNWALSWVIKYRIYGDGLIDFQGNTFAVAVSPSIVNMTCQTVAPGNAAFETITVYAGTFNALKVICRGEGAVSALVNGSPATGTITAQATQWFAPNVGLLRSQSDFVNFTVFGVTVPFTPAGVNGSIELRNYFINP